MIHKWKHFHFTRSGKSSDPRVLEFGVGHLSFCCAPSTILGADTNLCQYLYGHGTFVGELGDICVCGSGNVVVI